MNFIRKLPIPQAIKEEYPLPPANAAVKKKLDAEIADVFSGRSEKFILIIGPCSADREDAILDYTSRLARLSEKVSDKLILIPRLYTNKPRTTGSGYMGIAQRPDPAGNEDLLGGLLASRRLQLRVACENGLFGADEMLYPENLRYFNDLLSYAAVGARSCEDQQHRLVASGLDIPVGMKNPLSGDVSVMLNSVSASQLPHRFIYRGWEVTSEGNPLSHAVLRGYVKRGRHIPNFKYNDLAAVCREYNSREIKNPAVIVDASHSNSGRNPFLQSEICLDALSSRAASSDIRNIVKGFMIESYIEDGSQPVGGRTYGQSITDPCLGWEKSERLILEIAERI